MVSGPDPCHQQEPQASHRTASHSHSHNHNHGSSNSLRLLKTSDKMCIYYRIILLLLLLLLLWHSHSQRYACTLPWHSAVIAAEGGSIADGAAGTAVVRCDGGLS